MSNRRPVLCALLSLMSVGAVVARAAERPSTAPSNSVAQRWLDRAAAELPKMRAYDAGKLPDLFVKVISEDNMALMLLHASGADADRRRLVELAKRHENRRPDDDTPEKQLDPILSAALLYATAGEQAQARRLLPSVKAKTAEMTHPAAGLVREFILPGLRALLDDLSPEELNKLDLDMLAKNLESFGRSDAARRYAKLALRDHVPAKENIWNDMMFARGLAELGLFDEALRIADAVAPHTYHRGDAFAAVAEVRYRRGERDAARAAMRRGIEAAKAAPGWAGVSALATLVSTARDVGDRETLAEAADALAAAMEAGGNRTVDPHRWAQLAETFALLGRREDYASALKRFESTIPTRSGGDAKQQARDWFRVASAHAAGGEHEQVAAAVARSKAVVAELDEVDRSEGDAIHACYADAGHFDRALAAARDAWKDAGYLDAALLRIAAAQVRAGRTAEAEKTAAEIKDPFRRLKVLRFVALARVRAGRTQGLEKWVDAQPLPHVRAVLNLAVAQQMLGLEARGMTSIFKMQ